MTPRCADAIDWATLLAYHAGELAGDQEAAFEEHYFSCPDCTARLTALARLGDAIAELARNGRVFASVTGCHLERARAGGLRLRTYRLAPGESVACTIAPGDDANAIHLRADFTGVERVDLAVFAVEGEREERTEHLRDLAVDHAAGEVVLLYPGDHIRPLPRSTFRLELVAAESGGERRLGRYTLQHTPWPEP